MGALLCSALLSPALLCHEILSSLQGISSLKPCLFFISFRSPSLNSQSNFSAPCRSRWTWWLWQKWRSVLTLPLPHGTFSGKGLLFNKTLHVSWRADVCKASSKGLVPGLVIMVITCPLFMPASYPVLCYNLRSSLSPQGLATATRGWLGVSYSWDFQALVCVS